jgi:histidyl-tRNA synthetase
MRDFLPDDAKRLRLVEDQARHVARSYGYSEIVTPVVESYELLSAKAGQEVKSRMFVFNDMGGRDVALRPEFTASVARLVATTLRNTARPLRLFSVGSIYRYDEPQKGRYREFWQTNYELMGSDRPEADAEILLLTNSLMKAVGLKNFAFKVGHVGVLRGILNQEGLLENVQAAVMQLMDKKQYNEAFQLVESTGISSECMKTLRGLVEQKGKSIQNILEELASLVSEYEHSSQAVANLSDVLKLIMESEKEIDVTLDAGFARGLEYYSGMIFEVYIPGLDIALGGGGRYDKLIELFGGDPTPAVGVAHGIDRIMLALQQQKAKPTSREDNRIMIIPVKDGLRGEALKLAGRLRENGISVEVEVMGRKMGKALEDADRRGFSFVLIVGEKELREGTIVVKNLGRREQKIVRNEDIIETLKNQ